MLIYTILILITLQSVLSSTINNRYYYRLLSLTLLFNVLYCYNSIDLDSTNLYYLYNNCFTITNMVLFIHLLLYGASFILCNIWAVQSPSSIATSLSTRISSVFSTNSPLIVEHTLVILFILIGSVILASSNSLLSTFVSLELQSFSLYTIATIYKNSESSTAAGLKYLILGAFSSAIIVLGTAIVYITIGALNYTDISIILMTTTDSTNAATVNSTIFGIILIILGLLFKVSAAPLHNWAPDVYDGTPTIITTWLTVIPKVSLFYALYTLSILFDNNTFLYTILFSALCSLLIGTVLGVTSTRIKRLFTFSTISHVGFILLAISINTVDSCNAFLFYILQYTVSNAILFSLLLGIGYFSNMYYKTSGDLLNISNLSGLSKTNPTLAMSMGITLFSLAGIPPIIGFFAKINVLYSSISIEYYIMSIVAIVTSVISGYYYLKLIGIMFFADNTNITDGNSGANHEVITMNPIHSVLLSVIMAFILGYMLLFSSILPDVITLLSLIDYNL